MNIREFNIKDKDEVISLWIESDLVKPWNNPDQDIERKLKVNPELFLVGEKSGQIIASVIGGYEGHRGWINYLAVGKKYRRLGYGKEMMVAVENKIKTMGCPKINLQVRDTNIEVIEFYKSIGYLDDRVVGLGKRLEDDEQFNG